MLHAEPGATIVWSFQDRINTGGSPEGNETNTLEAKIPTQMREYSFKHKLDTLS